MRPFNIGKVLGAGDSLLAGPSNEESQETADSQLPPPYASQEPDPPPTFSQNTTSRAFRPGGNVPGSFPRSNAPVSVQPRVSDPLPVQRNLWQPQMAASPQEQGPALQQVAFLRHDDFPAPAARALSPVRPLVHISRNPPNADPPSPASTAGKRPREDSFDDEEEDQPLRRTQRSGSSDPEQAPASARRQGQGRLESSPKPVAVDEHREMSVDADLPATPLLPIEDNDNGGTPRSQNAGPRQPSPDDPFVERGGMSPGAIERHRQRFQQQRVTAGHTPFAQRESSPEQLEEEEEEQPAPQPEQEDEEQSTSSLEVIEEPTMNVDQSRQASQARQDSEMGEPDNVERPEEGSARKRENPYLQMTFDQWLVAGSNFTDTLGDIMHRFAAIQRTKRAAQNRMMETLEAHTKTMDNEQKRLDNISNKLRTVSRVHSSQ